MRVEGFLLTGIDRGGEVRRALVVAPLDRGQEAQARFEEYFGAEAFEWDEAWEQPHAVISIP